MNTSLQEVKLHTTGNPLLHFNFTHCQVETPKTLDLHSFKYQLNGADIGVIGYLR